MRAGLAPPQQIIIKQWRHRLFHLLKTILQKCESLVEDVLCFVLGGGRTPVAQCLYQRAQRNIDRHTQQIMRDGAIYAFDVDAIDFLDSLIVEASIAGDVLAADYCESASV
jgi:hypothetical protein